MKYALILLYFLIAGCSSSSESPSPYPYVTDYLGTRNYLKAVTVSGNVLQTENRFLSYTKNANRISIINPDEAKETWSKSASGFEYAVALPDFDGATLFAINKIVVMLGNTSRDFLMQSPYAHASAAKNYAAYSVASIDGQSIEIVRSLGNGQWQQDTFEVPWDSIDPSVIEPPDNQPILLVTQFNHDGTLLAVFSPADGRYAIYSAASTSEPIMTTNTWCSGDGIGTAQNATYRSLVWDEKRQRFFAGDKDGRIYAVDPYAECPTATTVLSLAMPDSTPIVYIAVFDNGELGVIQRSAEPNVPIGTGSLMTVVTFDNTGFTDTGKKINVACDRPLSAMTTVDSINSSINEIIVMCEQTSPPPPSETANARGLLFSDTEPYLYVSYDYTTGVYINTVAIDRSNSSGIAINKNTNTLYRMVEGAFGTLESINLENGDITKTIGLYLHDLL